MTKNPLINSASALGYIILISTALNYVSHINKGKPDTMFAPIAFLSLFTFSAALMGYFFLYQPIQLYLDGKKKEATYLFTRTLLYFGIVPVVLFTLFLLGILH